MALGREAEMQVIVNDDHDELDEEMALFVASINDLASQAKRPLKNKSVTFRHREPNEDAEYAKVNDAMVKESHAYGPSDSSSCSNFKFDEEDSM